MRKDTRILMALLSPSLLAGLSVSALAQSEQPLASPETGTTSPALCSRRDNPEPGLQGEVPAGQTANYNCGVRLLGQLPVSGNVQGYGECAYMRERGPGGAQNPITVIDVRDPAEPVVIGEPLPVERRTETFRVVVTPERAILVSGSTIYDISDCRHPRLLGNVELPNTPLPGIATNLFPHDLRINRTATRIYYSFGLWEVDISDLEDAESWTLTDHRCELAAQIEGPWQQIHIQANAAGRSLCDDATLPNPQGSDYSIGTSPLVSSLLWPQTSHSPDLNAEDTVLYIADQAGGNSKLWGPDSKLRIVDLTQAPYAIIGEANGGGHGLDWFRVGGREYVLHSNERGQAAFGDENPNTCHPRPRPTSLGWAFEGFITDVTDPAQARNASLLTLAINDPQHCEIAMATGSDASIAYHLIDDPLDARFAAANFGTAGLRIFDIRDPLNPSEVAYFNHGPPTHASVGHYDAERNLIYFSDAGGFKVLEIEPQVRSALGL